MIAQPTFSQVSDAQEIFFLKKKKYETSAKYKSFALSRTGVNISAGSSLIVPLRTSAGALLSPPKRLSLFVCFLTGLHKNYLTNCHRIRWKVAHGMMEETNNG